MRTDAISDLEMYDSMTNSKSFSKPDYVPKKSQAIPAPSDAFKPLREEEEKKEEHPSMARIYLGRGYNRQK